MTDISQHVEKVSQFPLKQTIFVSDYDLTLADKVNPANPDDSPLRTDHYLNLQKKAQQGMQVIVVTARGNDSASGYFNDHAKVHGPIPGLVLASNSGHVVNRDVFGKGEKDIIDIPGYSKPMLHAVVGGIHGIIAGMKEEYPEITADKRELCGAVVYKLPGSNKDEPCLAFRALAEELTTRLPKDIAKCVKLAPKDWEGKKDKDGNVIETFGYIDFTPTGMSKADPTRILMVEAMNKVKGPHYAIASGDSASDGPLLQAAAEQIPAERRVLVSVGDGLTNWVKDSNRHDVVFIFANGDSAINRYHTMLAEVGNKVAAHAQPHRDTSSIKGAPLLGGPVPGSAT